MSASNPSDQAPGKPKRVEVAVGIVLRQHEGQQQFLLGSRPQGKPYAGYWEFPGGKIEAGESVQEALRREFEEELGITIGAAEIWRVTEHDYEHALVRLHWCKVRDWQGEFEMREGQQVAWQTLQTTVEPILPGAYPVLDALAQEQQQ